MKFLRQLTRNGNSLMVTIPPQVIDVLRFRPGDPLVLEVPDLHTLTIRRPAHVDDLRAPTAGMTLDTTVPTT